jgi:hypothetical protein
MTVCTRMIRNVNKIRSEKDGATAKRSERLKIQPNPISAKISVVTKIRKVSRKML